MIIEYIKTSDPERAEKNLKFLIDTKLLSDPVGLIRKSLEEGQVPVLSTSGSGRLVGTAIDSLAPNDQYRKIGAAVGSLRSGDKTHCSAFLISDNLALTADFCVKGYENLSVDFGFISEGSPRQSSAIESVIEINENVGYAVLQLQGTPGKTIGKVSFAAADVEITAGERVVLIHHSNLAPLAISRGWLVSRSEDSIRYQAETAAGASGSPVLNVNGRVIAIHHSRVFENQDHKEGTPVTKILQRSKTLQDVQTKTPGAQ